MLFLLALVLALAAGPANAQVLTSAGDEELNVVYMISIIVVSILGVILSCLFCYCRMRNACGRSAAIEDGVIDDATDVALGLGIMVPSTKTSDAIRDVIQRDMNALRGRPAPQTARGRVARSGDPVHVSGILSTG